MLRVIRSRSVSVFNGAAPTPPTLDNMGFVEINHRFCALQSSCSLPDQLQPREFHVGRNGLVSPLPVFTPISRKPKQRKSHASLRTLRTGGQEGYRDLQRPGLFQNLPLIPTGRLWWDPWSSCSRAAVGWGGLQGRGWSCLAWALPWWAEGPWAAPPALVCSLLQSLSPFLALQASSFLSRQPAGTPHPRHN